MKSTIPVLILAFVFSATVCLGQKPDTKSAHTKTVTKFQKLLEQKNDEIIADAQPILARVSRTQLLETIQRARKITRGNEAAEIILSSPTQGYFIYEPSSSYVKVSFKLTQSKPVQIFEIKLEKKDGSPIASVSSLTWENLEQKLDQAAKEWFEGAVLVTRNGEVVLSKAYGQANRKKKIKNTTKTIFAIGSAPIDFTHAGILLLKDQGKLKLSDRITKYFDDVPEDKKSITIGHLMTGASGLRDFHDIKTDKNPDHTWIDRDEAIRRIMAQKLLFKPGTKKRHSHSAWGLLAAIIEIVSKETYPAFTKKHLFQPAGMNDTGFFGEKLSEQRVAVGYGHRKSSEPNSPPHWGKTSWLVMGSGGQTSTLGDMFRWQQAMRDGTILSPESTRQYLGPGDGVHANGDMFGFEFTHSTVPDQLFMLISNTIDSREKRRKFDQLTRQLYRLTRAEAAPSKYSLGVVMAIDGEKVLVRQVLHQSAAQRGGIQVGDHLLTANGESLLADTQNVLAKMLASGKPIKFEIERDGEKIKLTVKPLLKK